MRNRYCMIERGTLATDDLRPPVVSFFLTKINKKTAALAVEKGGEMKPAGMGRGDGVWHGQQSRGDNILWITEGLRGRGKLPEVPYTCTKRSLHA